MGLTLGQRLLQSRTKFSVPTHRSMRLSPKGLTAFVFLGWVLVCAPVQGIELEDVRAQMAAGDASGALASVQVFLESNPGHAQARFLKGIVLTEQERTGEAIEVFSALAADFPGLPEPHNNLAVLYAASGDYVKARDSLLMAINTHPSYATAHENLGDIYAKMAGLAYDRALQLDTENVSAKAKLALMHDLISATESSPVAVAATTTSTITTDSGATASSASATTEVASVDFDDTGVLAALDAWAAAWSEQNIASYLDAYASAFAPSNGQSRAAWKVQRQSRLSRPKFIRIDIDAPTVEFFAPDNVTIMFTQSYTSDTYSDRVLKAIDMSLVAGRWQIVRETTIE